jgi:2-dehydro-3-deoxygalactonokinase
VKAIEKFLSCDWGTSSFRLKLVESPGLAIIAESNSDQGIAMIFELWKQSGQTEDVRLLFYLDIIRQHIERLEKKLSFSLNDLPVIISGMACSAIGMIDLPYKEFPFSADGSELITKIIEADDKFRHKTVIISGAKTNDDAMRGEETQLAGCFHSGEDPEEQFFIFPGTHSKHVLVEKQKAVSVKTYMTGEFFEVLSKKTILSVSIEKGAGLQYEKNRQSFEKGISDSMQYNLLHSSFLVRTNQLFNKFTKQENYYYLSGLLIGTEMKELMNESHAAITLVSNVMLSPYYETVFKVLNRKKADLKIQNADEAVVRGQFKILTYLLQQN